MTITYDTAQSQLSNLLDQVAHGEEITITRDGKPIARIVPVEEQPAPKFPMTLEELKEWRKGLTLGPDLTIEQLIAEGRRF
jgi:prevent-host-death family protein